MSEFAEDRRGTAGNKKFTMLRVQEVRPRGDITAFEPPLRVRVTLRYNMGDPVDVEAWAVAYTEYAGYVYYRDPAMAQGNLYWLDAKDITRLGQPPSEERPKGRRR